MYYSQSRMEVCSDASCLSATAGSNKISEQRYRSRPSVILVPSGSRYGLVMLSSEEKTVHYY